MSGASSFINLEGKPAALQLEPVNSKRGQSEKLFENLSTVPKQNTNAELSVYPVAVFFHKYTQMLVMLLSVRTIQQVHTTTPASHQRGGKISL